MTRKFRRLCGMLLALNGGIFCAGAAWAASRETEEVTVDAPYTIREKLLSRQMSGEMRTAQISVESRVNYADLDLRKAADVEAIEKRIRHAAVQNCRELERRFPRSLYITVDTTDCVKNATKQSLARLDEIRQSNRRVAAAP